MPILILVVIGIIDFAFLFQRWEVVTNATREGARLASLGYVQADVEARVQSYLLAGGLTTSPTIVFNGAATETIDGIVVNTKTVEVTYPSPFIFLPYTVTLKSASSMRSEVGS